VFNELQGGWWESLLCTCADNFAADSFLHEHCKWLPFCIVIRESTHSPLPLLHGLYISSALPCCQPPVHSVSTHQLLEVGNVACELVVHDAPGDVVVVLIVVLLKGHRVELGADISLAPLQAGNTRIHELSVSARRHSTTTTTLPLATIQETV
jgi:hypothetical protein